MVKRSLRQLALSCRTDHDGRRHGPCSRSDYGSFNAMRRSLPVLTVTMLVLAACTSHDGTKANLADQQLRYANEPFPMRIVDRKRFGAALQPAVVQAPAGYAEGTIVVDTQRRQLHLIEANGKARRYGIGVGATGRAWSGEAVVGRKAAWPAWHPTDEMRQETPDLPRRIEPGPANPLGARALYLHADGRDTLYRIHGTSEPWTIGTEASSGCIRMLNEDVIDLYDRVRPGAAVVVL